MNRIFHSHQDIRLRLLHQRLYYLEEIKGFTTFKPGYVWDLSQTDGEPIDFNDELLVSLE